MISVAAASIVAIILPVFFVPFTLCVSICLVVWLADRSITSVCDCGRENSSDEPSALPPDDAHRAPRYVPIRSVLFETPSKDTSCCPPGRCGWHRFFSCCSLFASILGLWFSLLFASLVPLDIHLTSTLQRSPTEPVNVENVVGFSYYGLVSLLLVFLFIGYPLLYFGLLSLRAIPDDETELDSLFLEEDKKRRCILGLKRCLFVFKFVSVGLMALLAVLVLALVIGLIGNGQGTSSSGSQTIRMLQSILDYSRHGKAVVAFVLGIITSVSWFPFFLYGLFGLNQCVIGLLPISETRIKTRWIRMLLRSLWSISVLLVLLFFFSCWLMSDIERILMSECSWSCGFRVERMRWLNPIDQLLVSLASISSWLVPLDYVVFYSLLFGFLGIVLVGLVRLRGRCFGIVRLDVIECRKTGPTGLLFATTCLVLVTFTFLFSFSDVSPQYSMFGGQVFLNQTSRNSTTSIEGHSSSSSSLISNLCSVNHVHFDDPVPTPPELSPDDVTSDPCVLGVFAELNWIVDTHLWGAWGSIFFFAEFLFYIAFMISLIASVICRLDLKCWCCGKSVAIVDSDDGGVAVNRDPSPTDYDFTPVSPDAWEKKKREAATRYQSSLNMN